MSQTMYDYFAQLLGYVFSVLALLIVGNALIITLKDNRRARRLREQGMEAIGRLVVTDASGTQVYELTRNNLLGSSRKADVRIRHCRDVRRRHLQLEYREELDAFVLKGIGNASFDAPSADGIGAFLDGNLNNTFSIGSMTLRLELYGSGREHYEVLHSDPDDDEYDSLFN